MLLQQQLDTEKQWKGDSLFEDNQAYKFISTLGDVREGYNEKRATIIFKNKIIVLFINIT